MDYIPVIETKRLKLVPLDIENINPDDPGQFEQYLGRRLTGVLLGKDINQETGAAMRASLQNVIKSKLQDQWYEEWQSLLIILKDINKIIGGICFQKNSEEYGAAQIYFMIHPEHRNNGYMTEALQSGIPWIFQNPDIAYLLAETARDNLPSRRVLEKTGLSVYKETPGSLCWEIEY